MTIGVVLFDFKHLISHHPLHCLHRSYLRRAAQMGILGLMVHEMLPSHDPYMINGLLGAPIDFNAGF
jgi:hypothetical protein